MVFRSLCFFASGGLTLTAGDTNLLALAWAECNARDMHTQQGRAPAVEQQLAFKQWKFASRSRVGQFLQQLVLSQVTQAIRPYGVNLGT